MLDICLLGSGGVMPLPGRFLTSLYLEENGRAVLVDCGEGTQTAIRTAHKKFSRIGAIFVTHFHADHISGLVGLLLSFGLEGRTEALHMHGPEGLQTVVRSFLVIAPQLPFEIFFHEYSPTAPVKTVSGGLIVDIFPVDHDMPCLGYRFTMERAPKFDPDRARALGIPLRLWGKLQNGESVGGFSPADVLGEKRRGISVLYSTDTRPVEALDTLGKGVDLMILEGMYGDEEKWESARLKHHMMMQEAAEIAKRASAGELWLTHFSPYTTEPENYLDMLKEIFPNTVMGKDSLCTTLSFRD